MQNKINKNSQDNNQNEQQQQTRDLQESLESETIISQQGFESDQQYIPFKQTYWRWVVLALLTIFVFGNYYQFSVPATVALKLAENLGTDLQGYNKLVACYSYPNMILPIFAGIFVDKFGFRIGLLSYSVPTVLGSLLMYIANVHHSYNLFQWAMVIYGIGSEGMGIILNAYITTWFFGKELAISLGVIPTGAGVSAFTANWLAPQLIRIKDVAYPFLFGFIFIVVGVIGIIATCILDKYGEMQDIKNQPKNNQSQISMQNKEIEQQKEKVDYRQLNKTLFWSINLYYMFITAVVIPFSANTVGILNKFFHKDYITAGQIISLVTVLSTIMTPLFAKFTDKYGKKTEMMISSCIISIITMFCWMLLPTGKDSNSFYFSLVIFAFQWPIVQAIIHPMIPMIIPQNLLGIAFAIMDCFQQIGMGLSPLMVGWLESKEQYRQKNYVWTYIFFLILAVISLCIAIFTYIYNKNNGKQFDMLNSEMTKQLVEYNAKNSRISDSEENLDKTLIQNQYDEQENIKVKNI